MNVIMGIAMVVGMALAILLFFVLPTWLVNLMKLGAGESIEGWRSIIEGVMRIAIFIGYVALCGLQRICAGRSSITARNIRPFSVTKITRN